MPALDSTLSANSSINENDDVVNNNVSDSSEETDSADETEDEVPPPPPAPVQERRVLDCVLERLPQQSLSPTIVTTPAELPSSETSELPSWEPSITGTGWEIPTEDWNSDNEIWLVDTIAPTPPVFIRSCRRCSPWDAIYDNPNSVCARSLMDAAEHLVSRAVESPRYALPAARRCIAVVERQQTETFLESLQNACQQWYHDREKLLNSIVDGGRPRFMAFMSFLLEMYCQLRRRAIQLRSSSAQLGQVLVTLIFKCCEDCIRQPVPSASDTEHMSYVLTQIGRDLESQLPGELERLMTAVRDAFLNTSAAPSIRRTLLQLIELHASRWQLPGCAALYYYPSSK